MKPALSVLCLFAAYFLTAGAATASAQPLSARDLVVAENLGLRLTLAPGVLIPSRGDGNLGFAVTGDVRYGFEVGPFVIAPGARLAAYIPSESYVLGALATGRITWPVGAFGPYVLAGVGPGYLGDAKVAGLAHLAGAGLMFHIGPSFAVGAEVTYSGVVHPDYSAAFFGPSLLFNL